MPTVKRNAIEDQPKNRFLFSFYFETKRVSFVPAARMNNTLPLKKRKIIWNPAPDQIIQVPVAEELVEEVVVEGPLFSELSLHPASMTVLPFVPKVKRATKTIQVIHRPPQAQQPKARSKPPSQKELRAQIRKLSKLFNNYTGQEDQKHRSEFVATLVDEDEDLMRDLDGTSFVHWACFEGSKRLLQYLFSMEKVSSVTNTCLTACGDTFLHFACVGDNLEAVKLLVDASSNLKTTLEAKNNLEQTPLFCAASEGFDSIVSYLIEKGAVVDALNDEGASPLHYAAYYGQAGVMRILLANGSEPNRLSKYNRDVNMGETMPLLNAALKGHLECVKILVNGVDGSKKALVGFCNSFGVTALHNACLEGHLDVVKFLVASGAHVNAVTCDKTTPLINAVIGRHYAVVKFLIKWLCRLNMLTEEKNTALHFACMEDDFQIAKLLVDSGAATDIKNTEGKIPRQLTKSDSIRRLLISGLEINLQAKGTRKRVEVSIAGQLVADEPRPSKAPMQIRLPQMRPASYPKPAKMQKVSLVEVSAVSVNDSTKPHNETRDSRQTGSKE